MKGIETSQTPLVFRHDDDTALDLAARQHGKRLQLRTATRAMEGMQKEALVNFGPTGITWRIVCDEGPWPWPPSPQTPCCAMRLIACSASITTVNNCL